PRRPTPPPLPYPTLFRSGQHLDAVGEEGDVDVDHRAATRRDLDPLVELDIAQQEDADAIAVWPELRAQALPLVHDGRLEGQETPDRKSTRLNSSHVKTSY